VSGARLKEERKWLTHTWKCRGIREDSRSRHTGGEQSQPSVGCQLHGFTGFSSMVAMGVADAAAAGMSHQQEAHMPNGAAFTALAGCR
jgi:hypothetical protein